MEGRGKDERERAGSQHTQNMHTPYHTGIALLMQQ